MAYWLKTLVISIAWIALILGVSAVVALKQRSEDRPPTSYEPLLRCRSCGADFRASLSLVQPPPFKCPRCGKIDAWNLWRCNDCGAVFIPEMSGDPPHAEMIPQCPSCRGKSTGRL